MPQKVCRQVHRKTWEIKIDGMATVQGESSYNNDALWAKVKRPRKPFLPNYPGQQILGYTSHERTRALKRPSGQASNPVQWNMIPYVSLGISLLPNFPSEYCIPDYSRICWQFSWHPGYNKNIVRLRLPSFCLVCTCSDPKWNFTNYNFNWISTKNGYSHSFSVNFYPFELQTLLFSNLIVKV